MGIAGAAVSPLYPLALLLVLAGGLGVAAFHPEGAKHAAHASGRKRASGMSYFNIGGNTGYALGAFATGQLVVWPRALGAARRRWLPCSPSASPSRGRRGACRRSRPERQRRAGTRAPTTGAR